MPTRDELYTALRNADAAGDTAAATRLASHIRSTQSAANATPKPQEKAGGIGQGIGNLAAGAIRGAGSIGATLLAPLDMARDALDGKGLSLESNRQRRAGIDGGLQLLGAEPDSMLYQGGKLAGEIAGTAGAGGILAQGARAAGASPAFVRALATSGMRAGGPGTGALRNLGMRSLGGAASGAAAAGLANPEDAGLGALIGGGMPGGMLAAGALGRKVGSFVAGPQIPAELQARVAAARVAGYVIPPTQANPTLLNRSMEGFAGKLSTAQNASAKNQGVTNKLAAKAVGAADLSESALAAVRERAGAAYDEIKQVGQFVADDTFKDAISKAGAMSDKMKANFPHLVNDDVEGLVKSLDLPGFDSESTIEAIKQFRFEGSANKASMEPAKKALGAAQMKISNALEDLIDRNLQQAGSPEMLTNYRAARTTFAKLYDIEKAMNTTTRSIDPAKVAKLLDKGRPLTGELREIADFTKAFPKASKATEGMGSLPQTSPLDYAAAGGLSAATLNPWMMTGVVARPAARAMALSNVIQNRLLPGTPGHLERLLEDQRVRQLAYRSAPLLGRD